MPSLTYYLDRTEESLKSLDGHEFKVSGMFTNAIVQRPDITRLLKDPSTDENSLYTVSETGYGSKGIKLERVDGLSIYKDQNSSDYVDQEKPKAQSAVIIPEMYVDHKEEREPSSSPMRFARRNNVLITHTDDVNELCHRIIEIMQKYPNLINDYENKLQKVIRYQSTCRELVSEVDRLDSEIHNQRQQLNILNINYSDLNSPVKSNSDESQSQGQSTQEESDEPEIDVDEFIRKEEEEIRELEMQLDERQKLGNAF